MILERSSYCGLTAKLLYEEESKKWNLKYAYDLFKFWIGEILAIRYSSIQQYQKNKKTKIKKPFSRSSSFYPVWYPVTCNLFLGLRQSDRTITYLIMKIIFESIFYMEVVLSIPWFRKKVFHVSRMPSYCKWD